jgi:hypothetical protein
VVLYPALRRRPLSRGGLHSWQAPCLRRAASARRRTVWRNYCSAFSMDLENNWPTKAARRAHIDNLVLLGRHASCHFVRRACTPMRRQMLGVLVNLGLTCKFPRHSPARIGSPWRTTRKMGRSTKGAIRVVPTPRASQLPAGAFSRFSRAGLVWVASRTAQAAARRSRSH